MTSNHKPKRRLIPSVSFTNFHKSFPSSRGAFTRWLYLDRRWLGLIWNIGVRHYMLTLDFRGDWIADMRKA